MACECIKRTNEALERHNTELGVNWQHKDGALIQTIAIVTEVLTKKRGARPIRMIPNYCPICGVRYAQFPEHTSEADRDTSGEQR